MKKIIGLILIAIIVAFSFAYSDTIHAYNAAGWYHSFGGNPESASGQAYNVIDWGDSYTLNCAGYGECFRIIGGDLYINLGDGPGGGTGGGIWRN